ncbi:TPA: pyruvate:ferredoxin (flavodoxin) oxidoreductase, partial [Listeria monocytogenes]
PYTVNDKGHGPAWGNSLLEDNAEYGYGMYLANQTMRKALNNKVTKALREEAMSETLREALVDWQLQMDVSEDTRERAEALQLALLSEMEGNAALESIYNDRELFIKRSQWMLGGDGWAYDIGFGGIDHV